MMPQLEVNSYNSIFCSFNNCSLFTNISLAEPIEICIKTLYDSHLPTPVISKHVFIELMKIATTSVEFGFNNIMYRPIIGDIMGSLLGSDLAKSAIYMNQSFSMKFQNLPYTIFTVITIFLFFTKKLTFKNF